MTESECSQSTCSAKIDALMAGLQLAHAYAAIDDLLDGIRGVPDDLVKHCRKILPKGYRNSANG